MESTLINNAPNILRAIPGWCHIKRNTADANIAASYSADIYGVVDIKKLQDANHNSILAEQDKYPEMRILRNDNTVARGQIQFLACNRFSEQGALHTYMGIKQLMVFDDSIQGLYYHDFELTANENSDKNIVVPDDQLVTDVSVDMLIKGVKLTEREAECLFYLLRGNTAKLIARYMNISPRTVETHINTMKLKFNCDNKSQLIERVLDLGGYFFNPDSIIARKFSGH